jgi:hypothetical protein
MSTLSDEGLCPSEPNLAAESGISSAQIVLATATHHFTFPGPVRYQFRVLCEREADFPFLTGTSNVVRVLER